jgi:branched-chain amino acid transport system substrate-binding protein
MLNFHNFTRRKIMKLSTKLFALVLSIVMILGVFSLTSCNADNPAKDNDKIKIGLTGPLTGGASIYGIAVKNAAKLAVDEINKAGGLDGIHFELEMLDDKHDAANISTNYSSLLEGGMQVSLGTVTTAPGMEFKNLANDDNVFFLTPSASGDKIPEFANGFQMCFADGNQGKVAADFINQNFAGQTIGVFFKSDDPYSTGIFDQFKANLDPSVTIVETSFSAANETDFSVQIDTLKDCKFVFMPIYYTPASIFMTQGKDIMPADAVYYGCDGFDGIESNFDITTISQSITMLSHFNSKATDGAAKTFIDKYIATYGADTLNQFGASAYDCVYAIYGAMKKAMDEGKDIPVNISASELCEILKAQFVGGYTVQNAVTGESITWESNGYVNKTAIQYVIKEVG